MQKIPAWFNVIAILALVWNLLGAAAVIMNFMITPEQISALPVEQQELYATTPSWSTYASLLAVLGGFLGSLLLLLKKAFSYWCFIASIVGLIGQDIGIFVLTDAIDVMGMSVIFMQIIVFVLALALLALSHHAIKQSWIK